MSEQELDMSEIERMLMSDFEMLQKKKEEKEKEKEEKAATGTTTFVKKLPIARKVDILSRLRQVPKGEVTDDEIVIEQEEELREKDDGSFARAKLDKLRIPKTLRNPEMIKSCLTKDELVYFIDRWNEYYAEYGDNLNSANDYDQMVELCMCLIDMYRIQKKKKQTDRLVVDPLIDQIVHRTHTRIQNILASLKTRRKDRLEMSEHKEDNFVKLLCAKAQAVKSMAKIVKEEEIEEVEYIQQKIKRGGQDLLDAK